MHSHKLLTKLAEMKMHRQLDRSVFNCYHMIFQQRLFKTAKGHRSIV